MHTVHVRVNDAATGKPTPCRVRFTDAEGRYYAPFGRLTEFATDECGDVGGNLLLGQKKYAYIDGACEIGLPEGSIRVEISKGIEYKTLDQQIRLAPGKLALRFSLERHADLRPEGWYSGDTGARRLTPHATLLEGAGEDLAVVNVLAEETQTLPGVKLRPPFIPNILAFSGQQACLQAHGCVVAVNTVNGHPVLGRLALLHCHRAVYPLTFGGPDGADDWTLADWCDQCHRKGGLVIAHDFFGHDAAYHHGEVLADLILGKIDALDLNGGFARADSPLLHEWHEILNIGFRVPVVGGSGKLFNRDLLGSPRTYARLQPGQEFTYKNWIESVRAGSSFVTNGPLLSFTVNGQDPGAVIDLPSFAATVRVRAEAHALSRFDRLEVVCNGAVVAHAEASGAPCSAAVETDISVARPGWLTARCWGPFDDAVNDWVGAQTSPVYVRIDGKPPRPDAATAAPFLAALGRMLEWVARDARCDDAQRRRLAGVFEAARQELLGRYELRP